MRAATAMAKADRVTWSHVRIASPVSPSQFDESPRNSVLVRQDAGHHGLCSGNPIRRTRADYPSRVVISSCVSALDHVAVETLNITSSPMVLDHGGRRPAGNDPSPHGEIPQWSARWGIGLHKGVRATEGGEAVGQPILSLCSGQKASVATPMT